MGALQRVFGRYQKTATKDQIGGTLDRLKGVHEMLADVVEATKELDILQALKDASPWAEAVGNALGDAVPPVRFVLKLFEELNKIEDPNELGYLAATLAYQQAVEQAWQAMPPEVLAQAKAADPQLRKKALADLRSATPAEAYDFRSFSFDQALSSPFIKDAERFLEMSAQGLLDEAHYLNLQHGVRVRFVSNLKGILSHGSTRERFTPFRELMRLDTREARAYDALQEHADYQRWLYEEQKVLGSEPFTLAQVYADTDCGVLRWAECTRKNEREGGQQVDPFSEKFGGRQPLLETVLGLIANPKFKDVIVIQGVAGSGKSSATVRLAWELVRLGLRPIRIELKHLDAREQVAIEEALPEAVHLTSSERDPDANRVVFGKDLFLGGAIFDEYVHFRGTKICPYVLILDGWDEISIGATSGFQQRVALMLEAVRAQFFRSRAFPVRVILSGRPSHAIEQSRFLLADTQLLTVRPLSPSQLESYVHKVQGATGAGKGWSLAKVATLPKVLASYRQAHERAGRFGAQATLEVLGLPLLAHLALRLLASRPDDAEELLDDTTSLYRNLVDLVVGQAGKAPDAIAGKAMYKGEELRELLRGTAEAMTTFGAEAIPQGELAVRLGLEDEDLDSRARALADEGLSRLMISFFFKGGRKELGVEFSHKSFREYLFAEQVIEALKSYGHNAPANLPEREVFWKDFDQVDPRHELCHRLAALLGPVWVTPEVGRHLRGLLTWEIARAADAELELWQKVRDGLADAWDWWAEGVHLRPQPGKKAGNWQYELGEKPLALLIVEEKRLRSDLRQCPTPVRITSIDAHLGDGLFLLTSCIHEELAVRGSGLDEGASFWASVEEERTRRYQLRLRHKEGTQVRFAPTGPESQYFLNYCARINAGGNRPQGLFPIGANLNGANLTGACLRGADFRRAGLSGANLSGADLSGADLSGATLKAAILSEATLRWANLSWADLSGADLSGAYLTGAALTGAKLNWADLSRVNLAGANLGESYLNRANLSQAYLSGAYLSGANLNGANLSGAYLNGANLSGADLSGADLSGAYLSRADLSKADLGGADLSKADLGGADLSKADLRDALYDPEQLRPAIVDDTTKS